MAPIDTAFKSIEAADLKSASSIGVVNLAINCGHILFGQAEDGTCGKNCMVLGCILRNTAFADPGIPEKSIGQKAWQRHPVVHTRGKLKRPFSSRYATTQRPVPSK